MWRRSGGPASATTHREPGASQPNDLVKSLSVDSQEGRCFVYREDVGDLDSRPRGIVGSAEVFSLVVHGRAPHRLSRASRGPPLLPIDKPCLRVINSLR